MKSTIATAAAALTLAATATAQYNQSSAPFYLKVTSKDGLYSNATLESCHIGAAIEDLCITTDAPGPYSTYAFNTSAYVSSDNNGYGEQGHIVFNLPESGDYIYSQAMGIYASLSTNVGLASFGLEEPTLVSFDDNGLLNIQLTLDDTVSPPTDDTDVAYYRWYICDNNFEAYVYPSLSWVLGNQPPENPSCIKVDVTRQFI